MTNDKDRKAPLSLSPKGKLELKKSVETGQVRQSFSHGRSKVVQVEVRKTKKRPLTAGGDPAAVRNATQGAAMTDTGLTSTEMDVRRRVLEAEARNQEEARRRQAEAEARAAKEAEEARIRAEEEAKARAAEEARLAEEAAKAPPPEPEPEPVVAAQPAAVEEEAAPAPRSVTRTVPSDEARPGPRRVVSDEDDENRAKKAPRGGPGGGAPAPAKPAPAKRVEPKRRGKMTISAALSGDDRSERGRSVAAMRRAKQKEKRKAADMGPAERVVREVTIPDVINVQELANRMAERGANVIKVLMKMGVMATINQTIDTDTAELVVAEFGHTARRVSESDVELGLVDETPEENETLVSRPPVVTVMGHVDHGKTSLLDALRATDVAAGEAGGITQHIGAYQVTMEGGQKITFIDTPGHAAFTAMRARGAKVTDIVVLVVAANDGIMPQTIEAIRHARAAEVPVVVAINKMDLPDANPDKVRTDLLQHELVVEQMGGEVLNIEVSAKKRINLDKLEEAILLQSEILDLKANPNRACQGVVVEAKVEKGRGSVATVLVQKGTVKVGDIFVAGSEWGRVRALVDDRGGRVESAGPSYPVEVLGFQGTPSAGDDFIVVEDENRAREVSEYRQRKDREAQQVRSARGTMEQMFEKIQAGEARELPVVVKADVQGSVEALVGTLEKLGNDDVKIRVLHAAVGGINESDITLAKASDAVIIGFNVRANPQAREMARRDGIEIRYHSIIYAVADEMKQMLSGMLEPTYKETFIGYAQIREVFNITKVGKVAGCMITEGIVKRGAKVRLLRDDVVVHEGSLGQLKRFKDDVREVREGYECGMSFENYNDIQSGDVIECYEMEEVATVL
ncbi:translation initiation factor IF-2 [Rhodospirillum sp. A1_3_36]|uniref:translation initiation factor IF-2 n=1 Tax=Rhodospirillum sp. A1_3_36 TaxID=3391666 RepID=UPI0039A5CF88